MRNPFLSLLVISAVGSHLDSCASGALNTDGLFKKYELACGKYQLCNIPQSNVYYHNEFHRCPPCSCDENCFELNNCCPDVFFGAKYKVFTNFVIGSAADHGSDRYDMYEVIAHCPPEASARIRANCESSMVPKTLIRNPPVTSLATNLSYSNSHCAFCHGEQTANLVYWDMGIGQAAVPNQINLISPFTQMLKMGEMLQIPFLFTPPQRVGMFVKKMPIEYLVPSTCPDGADPDIAMACQSSYYLPFRFHKNIFCYICNLPKHNTSINSCNYTGHWDVDDSSIKFACSDWETSPMTYPYKNFYCFLCNTITNPLLNQHEVMSAVKKNVIHFYDAVFEYEERHSVDWRQKETLEIKLKNIQFRNSKMFQQISQTRLENHEEVLISDGWYAYKGIQIDIRSLIQTKVAMYPDRICNKNLLPVSVRNLVSTNCDCGIDCIFRNVCSCCVDTALMSAASCLSDAVHYVSTVRNEETEIIVIDGCSMKETYLFFFQYKKLCEKDTGIFSSLFVTNGTATFKNVFCFFCNSRLYRLNTELLHNPFTPIDINFICPRFLHFLYAGSIKDVIDLAKSEGCSVFFDTDKTTKCRKKDDGGFGGGFGFFSFYDYPEFGEESKTIDVCNSTGNIVHDIDFNIRWACENISDQAFPPIPGFKNEFCLLCNANDTAQNVNTICEPSSSNYLKIYRDGCESLPDVSQVSEISPSKNAFCYACNNSNCLQDHCFPNSSFNVDTSDCISSMGSYFRIRQQFVLQKYSPSVIFYASPKDEIESETYGCYPGRALIGNTCELLLSKAKFATYGVDISVALTVNSTYTNASVTMEKIEQSLGNIFLQHFPENTQNFLRFLLLLNKNSSSNLPVESAMSNVHLLVDLYFEVQYMDFDRRSVEAKLLNFPRSIEQTCSLDNGSIEYKIKSLGFSYPADSIKNSLPDALSTLKLKDIMKSYFKTPPNVILVGNLLFCMHEKLNSSLFFFDDEKLEIISNKTMRRFKIGEFVLDFGGFIGVCIYGNAGDNSPKYLLDRMFVEVKYLPTVFNGVSALCMTSVFISYCYFKILRTPTGVNAIFVSLFLSWFHLVGSLVKLLQHIKLACFVIGLALHYFWLSISCSVCVAACHQFSLFRNTKMEDKESQDKTKWITLIHLIFSLFTPMLVVGLNAILLHLFLSDPFYYSPDKCFLSHHLSYIVTFLSPLILSVIVIILFNGMALKMVITLKGKIMKKKKAEFFILLKFAMFVCMFAILQITELFVDTPDYSFVIDLMVSTQGCFVFLAFCCSSHICGWRKNNEDSLSVSDINQTMENKMEVEDTE